MRDGLPDLHLEITTKCALACPACPRTENLGKFPIRDLPLTAIQKVLNSNQRYGQISLCGDHGDPIYHSEFHKVIEVLQRLPGEPPISVATNGSYMSEAWWRKTAQIMRSKDEFIFGIDGLEDTSHLYRRKNNWKSIYRGIEILKQEGVCEVQWQWILFFYNQHQLKKAANVAKKLKVDNFMIIGSSRHHETDHWSPTISIEQAEGEFREAYDLSTL